MDFDEIPDAVDEQQQEFHQQEAVVVDEPDFNDYEYNSPPPVPEPEPFLPDPDPIEEDALT